MKENSFEGRFIVVEGADGAGTTTQAEKLADRLDAYYTAEPTENGIGEKVDELISNDGYSAESVALAFAADRMVHLEEEVIPKLKEGETVVCDRYYHSSLVYQPALGAEFNWVKELNRAALKPDVTFILDISAEVGMARVEGRGRDGNIFEELGFQQEVVERYRQLPEKLEERIEIIDGSRGKDAVFRRLMEEV